METILECLLQKYVEPSASCSLYQMHLWWRRYITIFSSTMFRATVELSVATLAIIQESGISSIPLMARTEGLHGSRGKAIRQ